MRVLRLLAAVLAGCSVCLAQNNLGDLMKRLNDYPKREPAGKVEVLRVMAGFPAHFRGLVDALPEQQAFLARNKVLQGKLEELILQIDASSSKEQLDECRAKISELIEEIKKLNQASVQALEPLAQKFGQTLTLGVRDKNPEVKREAALALLELSKEWFQPGNGVYRDLCGLGAGELRHGNLMKEAVSGALRDAVRRSPSVLLPEVLKKPKEFGWALVALAEGKNSAVRAPILALLDTEDDDELRYAYFCIAAWQVPGALPKLVRRAELGKDEYWSDGLEGSFLRFGAQAPKALALRWSHLPEEGKAYALRMTWSLPCADSLRLIEMGLAEKSGDLRLEAVYALSCIRDVEWDEDWSGPDPKDLSDTARLGMKRRLEKLTQDKDPRVRQAAVEALEEREAVIYGFPIIGPGPISGSPTLI